MPDKNTSKQLRNAFMNRALHQVMVVRDGQAHPLAFLVDRAAGKWKSRDMHAVCPTVQAGHLTSRHSGEEERLALEDSTWNQWSSHRGESQGAIFFKEAVLIGGIPVERRTAVTWEAAGLLPRGTVASALASSGWSR
jgi:hypothetical protein